MNKLERLIKAEKLGVKIIPKTEVIRIEKAQDGGYQVTTKNSIGLFNLKKQSIKAKGVIFAAGALGTNKLLMENKRIGTLPKISDHTPVDF